jgi:FtsP/CotA-like multicopper oxidase with cupredoxin domain
MDFARSLKLEFPLDPAAPRAQVRGQGSAEMARLGGNPRAPLWSTAESASRGPALFSAARGRTVMLAFANPAPEPCAIHLHGHHFRLLDALDDGWKPFWLDTLLVAPGQTARIAFVADNPGRWLLGWRALERPSAGQAAWFEVK